MERRAFASPSHAGHTALSFLPSSRHCLAVCRHAGFSCPPARIRIDSPARSEQINGFPTPLFFFLNYEGFSFITPL